MAIKYCFVYYYMLLYDDMNEILGSNTFLPCVSDSLPFPTPVITSLVFRRVNPTMEREFYSSAVQAVLTIPGAPG